MELNSELHNLEIETLDLIAKCDRISKVQGQTLTTAVSKIINFANKLIITNAKLEERVAMQEHIKATEQKLERLQASFEKILERPQISSEKSVQASNAGKAKSTSQISKVRKEVVKKSQPKFTCIISPKEVPASFSSQDMRKEVVKNLQASSSNLKIKALKVLPSKKSVVIETADAGSLEKIMNNSNIAKGSNIRVPGKRNPKIIIKHVPTGAKADDVRRLITAQNQDRFPDLELSKELTPRFKVGPKDKRTEHWVCEVTPKLHIRLREKHESCFYYEEYRLRVETYISVLQCHKCLRFGHIAGNCREPKKNCGHCGDVEHHGDQCTSKNTPRCINCVRRRRSDTAHTAWSKTCPSYLEQLKLSGKKTDYGY